MLRNERLKYILDLIDRNKSISIQTLSSETNASTATIRRDLELLSEQNRIILVRGGAVSKSTNGDAELPYDVKRQRNTEEKIRIASAAAAYVNAGDTIILDSGTTTKHMVPFLAKLTFVSVITCDIAIAASCSYYPNIEVNVIGGKLRTGYYNLYGYIAENTIRTLNADIAFCSTDTICVSNGCMITNIEEVFIKQKILECADRGVMLCDHTKIGRNATVSMYGVSDLDAVITGKELSPETLETFGEMREKFKLV